MSDDQDMLNRLFVAGRTYPDWEDKEVPPELLERLFALLKYAPTSMNCCPLRLVFVTSKEQKNRLLPCLSEGNVAKVKAAPVCVICAFDQEYHRHMSHLWAHQGAKVAERLASSPDKGAGMGQFNATLQAGYFILAARALGLDCGPMAGFDKEKVNQTFLNEEGREQWISLMLCNIGYGKKESLHPRQQRLSFDQSCHII